MKELIQEYSASPTVITVSCVLTVCVFLVMRDSIGIKSTVSLMTLVIIACILVIEVRQQNELKANVSKRHELNDIISDGKEIDDNIMGQTVASADELDGVVIPQDVSYQVSITDIKNYVYIPMHPELLACLTDLGKPLKRRPAAVKTCLALLERFLLIHSWIMNIKTKKKLTNTRRNEIIKQKISDMALLRLELLEQLHQVLFEFNEYKDVPKKVIKASKKLRDYTHSLVVDVSTLWKNAIPSLGNAMPPFGVDARDNAARGAAWSMYLTV